MSIGATSSASSTVTAATISNASAGSSSNVTAVAQSALAAKQDASLVDENGRNALHRAAMEGKTHLLDLIIWGKNYPIDSRDKSGCTPLMLAAWEGQRKACEVLIKARANLEAADAHGWNALHFAAYGEKLEVIPLFLPYKRLLESKDKHGRTPLMIAAWEGHRKVCEILIKAGANVDALDVHGWNAFHVADFQGHLETYGILAKAKFGLPTPGSFASSHVKGETVSAIGVTSSASSTVTAATISSTSVGTSFIAGDQTARRAKQNMILVDEHGRNALHRAAMEGKTELLRLLIIAENYLIDSTDETGKTPLMLAAWEGQHEACDILIKAKANVYALDAHRWNALHLAAYKGKLKIVRLFLQYLQYEDLLNSRNKSGDTPLIVAALQGCREICEVLIHAGAEVEIVNARGLNALHLAVYGGNLETTEFFLKYNRLLESKDESDVTPLLLAASLGHVEICEILVDAKANVDAVDANGWNALHRAAFKGNLKIVGLFLSYRNLFESKTNSGDTPLILAAFKRYREVCKILIKAGANVDAVGEHGRNALHWAVGGEKFETVRLFVQYKNLLESRDNDDNTPLMLAAYGGYLEVCEILVDAKADIKATNKAGENALDLASKNRHTVVVSFLTKCLQTARTTGLGSTVSTASTTSSASSSSPQNSVGTPAATTAQPLVFQEERNKKWLADQSGVGATATTASTNLTFSPSLSSAPSNFSSSASSSSNAMASTTSSTADIDERPGLKREKDREENLVTMILAHPLHPSHPNYEQNKKEYDEQNKLKDK